MKKVLFSLFGYIMGYLVVVAMYSYIATTTFTSYNFWQFFVAIILGRYIFSTHNSATNSKNITNEMIQNQINETNKKTDELLKELKKINSKSKVSSSPLTNKDYIIN